jgi:hypothetical protein
MAQSGSGNPIITAALARMALLRQADISDVTLDLYTAELAAANVRPEDVTTACEVFAGRAREQGETSFPEMGRLRVEIEAAARRRRMRDESRVLQARADEPTFRCYQCQDDPQGWIELQCPQSPCEREKEHQPHPYVVRCPHWLKAKREQLQRSAQDALQKGERPSMSAQSLQDLDMSVYRYQRAVTTIGRAPMPSSETA